MDKIKEKIAFIGCGNMAKSIISGVLSSGIIHPEQIYATKRDLRTLDSFSKEYPIQITSDNNIAIDLSDVIFLCIKPHQIKELCLQINQQNFSNKIFISVAAGISCIDLSKWLDKHRVIRAMPNVCIQVKEGVTALTCNEKKISTKDKELVNQLLTPVSKVYWLKNDEQINISTLISGSAPAYFYYIAQSILNKAKEYPIEDDLKKEILIQTMLGAATLAKQKNTSFDDLIKQIMSPNGVTQAAIDELKVQKTDENFMNMLEKAYQRNLELSQTK